jgi:hypothetical protein
VIKYLVQPGWIISMNDGQWHFIGIGQLIRLYRVNPRECTSNPLGLDTSKLVVLRPEYGGNYTLEGGE